MIAALLLAASVPTAVDAEFDFARDAQRIGQWTAFRKWADKDAVTFTPQAVWAREFLKDNPAIAEEIERKIREAVGIAGMPEDHAEAAEAD